MENEINEIQVVNRTKRVHSDSLFVNGFEWMKRNALPVGLLVNQLYPVAGKLSVLINALGVKLVGYNYYLLPALYISATLYVESNKKQRKLITEIASLIAIDSVMFLTTVKENNGLVINKLTAAIVAQTGTLIFGIIFILIALEIFVKAMHLYAKTYKNVTTDSTVEFVKDVIADVADDGMLNNSVQAGFRHQKRSEFDISIGKTLDANKPVFADIRTNKHTLIAGFTGSGKTVFLNCLLGQMMDIPTELLNLVLIDPKVVGLAPYRSLPHLLTDNIINECEEALTVLTQLVDEMDKRYKILGDEYEDIKDYNDDNEKQMPYIVCIIDEFGDLILASDKKLGEAISNKLKRLAAKARGAGIYLYLCTQRPDANIIDGNLKANLTTTICLKVKNQLNSSIVIDRPGAEKLKGNGHMIYISDQGETELQGDYRLPE